MVFWETHRDPWLGEFARLQKSMTDLFSSLSEGSAPSSELFVRRSRLFPPMNVSKLEAEYRVSAEIPGVKADEIELTVHGDTLNIKGERKPIDLAEDVSYHRRERSCGGFQRSITLPENVDADNIGASYKNGILTVTLPISKAAAPKKIAVATD